MIRIFVFALIACYSSLAFGLEHEKAVLTLSECLKIAHQENPGLLNYREILIALQHKQESLFRDMLPDVSLSWSGKEVYEDYTDAYSASVKINQTLFQGKRAYTNWKIAGLETRRSALELARQYQSITYRVKKAWYELLEKQELFAEAIQSLERLKQHASNAKHFFKEGWIWRTDVLEAQVKVARGEQSRIIAENDVARARARLNILMHRDVNNELNVNEKLTWIKNEWTYEKAKAESIKNRPDLLQAQIDLEKSQSALTVERSSYYPNLSASASWTKSDQNMDMHDGVEDIAAQLNASWTIWEWGKTNESVAAAKAKVRQSRLLIKKLEDQLLLDLHEAWLSVQEAEKKVQVLAQALAQGEENFRVNIIRYRERLGTAKDVLEAQDLLTSTRKDRISALSEYLSSLANLDYAIGMKKYDIYQ
ncbi:outer membrane efflux protein [Candidatus Magnetomorum sp. HK-1]|nr:outer membrane efflux protein [Candidatus Magnetomorum sp. HK-1]